MIFGQGARNHQKPRVVERYELDEQGEKHVTVSLQTDDVFWGKTEVILEKVDTEKNKYKC